MSVSLWDEGRESVDDDLNDDLTDLIGGTGVVTKPRRPGAPGFVEDTGHVESCPKCHGTGTFTSYTGRAVGPCFTCKGKGKRLFKTSSEQRARSRAGAAERRARDVEGRVAAFAESSPGRWEWIVGNPGLDFAVAMREAVERYGDLTERQGAAIDRCIAKAAERKAARDVKAAPVDISAVKTALDTAHNNGLSRPKLRMGAFVFSRAPDAGRNAGAVYVKQDGQYLGKIADGVFQPAHNCAPEQRAAVTEVAASTVEQVIAYGRETGRCSCCGRELTDPASIDAGIGPICASKFFG